MPILQRESCCYPENLLDEFCSASTDRRWWVFYTKARQEKALARDLVASATAFYLPLVPKTLVYGGRCRTSHVPLFSGYVFVFGYDDERIRALTTNRVSRTLDVPDPAQLVADLQQISWLIGSGAPLTVEARLAPGQRVRVRRGPFAGLEGTIVMRRGISRLLISVNFLQQGVSVEIDDFLVEQMA